MIILSVLTLGFMGQGQEKTNGNVHVFKENVLDKQVLVARTNIVSTHIHSDRSTVQ